jgi:hypothetical protein
MRILILVSPHPSNREDSTTRNCRQWWKFHPWLLGVRWEYSIPREWQTGQGRMDNQSFLLLRLVVVQRRWFWFATSPRRSFRAVSHGMNLFCDLQTHLCWLAPLQHTTRSVIILSIYQASFVVRTTSVLIACSALLPHLDANRNDEWWMMIRTWLHNMIRKTKMRG